ANVTNVGVLPTVIVNYRPSRIQPSGHPHHSLNEGILSGMLATEVGEAHTFIDRHPGDYTGMVLVASHCRLPFRGKRVFSGWRPLTSIRHFLPNHEAQAITPVEPSRIFNFLVLA